MPTAMQRASAVVGDWCQRPDIEALGISTSALVALRDAIEGAIDAQVADWMASPPKTNGWHAVAAASEVVAVEPAKDYLRPRVATATLEPPGQAGDPVVHLTPEQVADEDCRLGNHRTRWDAQNTYLECRHCGRQFRKGTCIRCGEPAVSDESFSCGRSCQSRNQTLAS